jgi:hypothetical protein
LIAWRLDSKRQVWIVLGTGLREVVLGACLREILDWLAFRELIYLVSIVYSNSKLNEPDWGKKIHWDGQ